MKTTKGMQTLVNMMKEHERAAKKNNKELAQSLVDLTNDMRIDSPEYQTIMEAAFRLSPQLFEEA